VFGGGHEEIFIHLRPWYLEKEIEFHGQRSLVGYTHGVARVEHD